MAIHYNNNNIISNIHYRHSIKNYNITNVYCNDANIFSIPNFTVSQFNTTIPKTAEVIIFENIANVDFTNLNFVAFLDTAKKIQVYNNNNNYYILAKNPMRFPGSCYNLLQNYNALQTIAFNFVDTRLTTNYSSFFADCTSLQTITWGTFNMQSAAKISNFFYGCTSLQTVDLSVFNNVNTTNYLGLFNGCTSLQTVDLSVLHPVGVTEISKFFEGCTNLQTADFSTFNFNNANIERTFYNCNNITSVILFVDGNMNNCRIAFSCFYDNFKLKTIYSNDITTAYNDDMFYNCNELVGGAGFTFDSAKITAEYAKINTSTVEGYFTNPNSIT